MSRSWLGEAGQEEGMEQHGEGSASAEAQVWRAGSILLGTEWSPDAEGQRMARQEVGLESRS